jgi:thymidylate synthase
LSLQCNNKPFPFPTIKIKEIKPNIEDYTLDDIEIINYQSHGKFKMEMRK